MILYTVRVENTGVDASLHNITGAIIPDLTLTYQSGDSDLDGVLDVTETWIYTGSYSVTQAEIDAGGMIHSVVTATSTDIPSDTYAMDVTIVQTPDMLVTLSADPTSVDEAGDVIDYTLTVENTGNLTLTGITLVDSPDLTWALTGTPTWMGTWVWAKHGLIRLRILSPRRRSILAIRSTCRPMWTAIRPASKSMRWMS